MRSLALALLTLTLGCTTFRAPPQEEVLVHTDRVGFSTAHAHNHKEHDPDAAATRFPAVKLPAGSRIVDLTHAFDADTVYWPTEKSGFVLQEVEHGKERGYFYATNRFAAPEHGGTHLDAPIHFADTGVTADGVPLAKLVAPAAVIDMRVAAEASPDALLDVAAIEDYEKTFGPIVAGTIVLVRTGWASRWPDRRRYLGDERVGTNAATLHFPGISEEAANALVDRQVAAVGIDTASVDHGPSKDFRVHRTLAANDIPAFENITHLDLLPQRGALVVALPMKIRGGSGGPLRIVAVVPGATTKTALK
jgi:kynurenine formamidase